MPVKSRRKGRRSVPAHRELPAAAPPVAPATGAFLAASLALTLITIATFAPVAGFDFVHYDDFEFVVENPHVAGGMTMENVTWALANPYVATGGPLTWLSHMLDVEMFGLRAGGHHVTNLTIHVLSTLTLFLVLRSATSATGRSAFVAALFAIHPLHVESVAWIAERKDVLSGLFWFATTGAYIAYARRPAPWRYGVVLVLFTCGLLSKPMVATLPFVLLLMDYWPLGRVSLDRADLRERLPRLTLEKVPLIALGAAALALTLVAQRETGAVSGFETVPLETRLANSAIAYTTYLWKVVWPEGLIPYYPYRLPVSATAAVISATLLAGLTLGALAVRRRAPPVSVGWFWFLGTLIPVIGLVQVGGHAMADRFTYLPLVGLFIAMAWGAPPVVGRWRLPRWAMPLSAAVIVGSLAVTARAQTLHWRNGLALWQHTLRVDPDNARAHSNLGVVLAAQNRTNEAIRSYEEALRLAPPVAKTLFNLGLALAADGQTDAAIARFSEAVRLDPGYFKARMELGGLLAESGRRDEAIEQFRRAVQLQPDEPLARVNLAVGLGQSGRPAEALPHMLEAVRLQPQSAQWRYFAGLMMAETGRTSEAVAMFESALMADPHHQEARQALRELTGRK